MRLLLFFLVLNAPLFAQHELSGIVVDAADGKPLSFVHVFLKTDQQYGVITNERGEYKKVYNKLLYVTDVITDPKAIKAYRKGTLLSTEALIEDIRTPYRPVFWETNPLLILLPAPEALEEGLSRIRSMEAQFRENARKVVKE